MPHDDALLRLEEVHAILDELSFGADDAYALLPERGVIVFVQLHRVVDPRFTPAGIRAT